MKKRILLATLTSQTLFMSVSFSAGYITNQNFNNMIDEVDTLQKLSAYDLKADLNKKDSLDRRENILAHIRQELALK